MTETKDEVAAIKHDLKRYVLVLGGFVALIVLVELVDQVAFGGALDHHGIQPRSMVGLGGVLFAPFLHVGFVHILSNAIAFLALGTMVMLREEAHFWVVTFLSAVFGGLLTWLIGSSDSVHVGSSGIVFGYFGYLLLTGWFERRVGPILLSIFVLLGWGGLIFGVLPTQDGVSWEGHLTGFLVGVLCARLLARRSKTSAAREGA